MGALFYHECGMGRLTEMYANGRTKFIKTHNLNPYAFTIAVNRADAEGRVYDTEYVISLARHLEEEYKKPKHRSWFERIFGD